MISCVQLNRALYVAQPTARKLRLSMSMSVEAKQAILVVDRNLMEVVAEDVKEVAVME